jgi:hypothetical protein
MVAMKSPTEEPKGGIMSLIVLNTRMMIGGRETQYGFVGKKATARDWQP